MSLCCGPSACGADADTPGTPDNTDDWAAEQAPSPGTPSSAVQPPVNPSPADTPPDLPAAQTNAGASQTQQAQPTDTTPATTPAASLDPLTEPVEPAAMAEPAEPAAQPEQDAACQDLCPVANGVAWGCQRRFMYGLNYAWREFGADFGGNQHWNLSGVSQNPQVEADLAHMAELGAQVIRWWVWPNFSGDGVQFADDQPQGLGGTALADLDQALALAERYDLYLMLTLFSFDNFRTSREEGGLWLRSIEPYVTDTDQRTRLLERVLTPFVRAAATHPLAHRLIAWDIINEPEWAMHGPSLYGDDEPFEPSSELDSVSHREMETFLGEVAELLQAESQALVTVGATAMKWRNAWSQLPLDFYQFHMYDWVNDYWPYNRTPTDYGFTDKPVIMGEFPLDGLADTSYDMLVSSWYDLGYAGAMGWAYTDSAVGAADNIQDFARAYDCETHYAQ